MPIRVVLDIPPRYASRRAGQRVAKLFGGLFVFIGFACSVPAFVSTLLLLLDWWTEEPLNTLIGLPVDINDNLVRIWLASCCVTVGSLVLGIPLVRGRRKLVLFLRRFGFQQATFAVTVATRSIGGSWRVVTLDDAAIAPLGVSSGVKQSLNAFTKLKLFVTKSQKPVSDLVQGLWGTALIGAFCYLGYAFYRAHQEGDAPSDDSMHRIETALHYLLIVFGIAFFGLLALVALGLVGMVFLPALSMVSMVIDSVRQAEAASTMVVPDLPAVNVAALAVARRSRKVFSAKLTVLRVNSAVWRPAVRTMAASATVTLIDVSQPSQNLLWEIEGFAGQFASRCVFIGQHDHVARLAYGRTEDVAPPGSIGRQLRALLNGHEVLAYTTDKRGLKRFVRALRTRLESRVP